MPVSTTSRQASERRLGPDLAPRGVEAVEQPLGGVLIVRPAPQPHALHGGCAPARNRIGVVVLEPGAGRAAATGIARERALSPIALPDRALDPGRDGTAPGRAPGPGARPGGGRESALLELADQGIEGAVDHRGELGGGGLVAQERLGVAHLLVGVLANRDLESEAPGCERRQLASRGG